MVTFINEATGTGILIVADQVWKPALEKAGIEYRPMMQTRHTFATISLSEGENIGWVQHMLGHSSL